MTYNFAPAKRALREQGLTFRALARIVRQHHFRMLTDRAISQMFARGTARPYNAKVVFEALGLEFPSGRRKKAHED